MSAKILAFDPNRKVPARRYTPTAMRGRLLYMPNRPAENTGLRKEPANTAAVAVIRAVPAILALVENTRPDAEPSRVTLNAAGWGSFPRPVRPDWKLK